MYMLGDKYTAAQWYSILQTFSIIWRSLMLDINIWKSSIFECFMGSNNINWIMISIEELGEIKQVN